MVGAKEEGRTQPPFLSWVRLKRARTEYNIKPPGCREMVEGLVGEREQSDYHGTDGGQTACFADEKQAWLELVGGEA